MRQRKTQYNLEKGLTLWLTGLSGSGKSTLANGLAKKLLSSNKNFPLDILDGDEIRENLCKDLGFSKEDRITNVRRIGYLAGKISAHKVLVIVPVIAPYIDSRYEARYLSKNFLEVYIKASLNTVKKRDTKGLYKKALKGEITNLTGVNDPYEEPYNPDLIIETDKQNIDSSVQNLVNFLVSRAYISDSDKTIKNFLTNHRNL